jgi:hypothetical protein
MNKQNARNALVIVGAWSLSGILAWVITILLIPINNRLMFSGESGIVIMWLWSALPEALTAAAAVTAIVLIETRRPWPWIGGLIALYLYSGVMTAFRTRSGFLSSPTTPDYVGMTLEGILPALACGIAGIWIARRRMVTRSQRHFNGEASKSRSAESSRGGE